MENYKNNHEEIFIVGSRYGELADVITPLYNTPKPIQAADIIQALGCDEVYLKPVPNDHDVYAVAVYAQDTRRIGFVWMYQAPTMRYWLEKHHRSYAKVHITGACPSAQVLMAEMDMPLDVPTISRRCENYDAQWASDLPEVMKSISDQSLELGLMLLRDELADATQWSRQLEKRIDTLLENIPLDLSAYRHNAFVDVFKMMRQSKIKEVREHSDLLLHTLVYRGSKEHVSWWAEKWLPSFFREAAEGDLLGVFEAAHYTLQSVEELLDQAPAHLFYLYEVNRTLFVNRLYYSALPQEVYNRLLTLLAVREAMLLKKGQDKPAKPTLTKEVLTRAIEAVQQYFWGYSSNAIIFCVCRDRYGLPDNASLFERETRELHYRKEMKYLCTDGTISNAFSRSPYLKLNIDKWESAGAKERSLILRDEFIKAVEKACEK